jgi:predicted component of type VI protein secretion system
MPDAAAKSRRHVYFVVKEPGAPDRILILDTQELTIGRSNDSDLQAKYAEVSRRQAVIKRDGQKYLVQNMSTSSGTIVNGSQVQQHTLSNGDAIRISQLEITYVESTENPATVGPKLEYASQLKDFAPGRMQGDNPEATTLGAVPAEEGSDAGDFKVRPAGDFGYGLDGSSKESSGPRDLDRELDEFGLHGTPEPVALTPEALAPTAKSVPRRQSVAGAKPAKPDEAWTLDDEDSGSEVSASTLSLTLEIEGLTPDLQQTVGSLIGKVISLPSLKIRLKGKDLG